MLILLLEINILSNPEALLKFLYQGPHSDFTGPNCGSTACVALVRNKQLVVANAGDSRCVISRGGKVILVLPWLLKKLSLTA